MNNPKLSAKVSLPTKEKILRLRALLSQISNTSFAFSKINKDYPLDYLNEENGLIVISFYENLIRDTLAVIENYRKELRF